MTRRLIIEPTADHDLDDIFDYIAERNADAAALVYKCARRTFDRIAEMPEIGRYRDFGISGLHGMRVIPIERYRNYLVFYLSDDDTVRVLRVLHGARDLDAVFHEE